MIENAGPRPAVNALIEKINDELAADDEWFVIVIATAGNIQIGGSSIDHGAALRAALIAMEGGGTESRQEFSRDLSGGRIEIKLIAYPEKLGSYEEGRRLAAEQLAALRDFADRVEIDGPARNPSAEN